MNTNKISVYLRSSAVNTILHTYLSAIARAGGIAAAVTNFRAGLDPQCKMDVLAGNDLPDKGTRQARQAKRSRRVVRQGQRTERKFPFRADGKSRNTNNEAISNEQCEEQTP